jgi:hypothetical protein
LAEGRLHYLEVGEDCLFFAEGAGGQFEQFKAEDLEHLCELGAG